VQPASQRLDSSVDTKLVDAGAWYFEGRFPDLARAQDRHRRKSSPQGLQTPDTGAMAGLRLPRFSSSMAAGAATLEEMR
jgi:hypothetical protein